MNVKWKQSAASLLFFILTQSISLVHAADVLIGNSKNKEQTFSFPIGVSTIGKIQQNGMFGNSVASERYFYIGAADQTAGEDSLARVSSMGDTFESLTPEEVTLNGKKKQKNLAGSSSQKIRTWALTAQPKPRSLTHSNKGCAIVRASLSFSCSLQS